MAWLGLAFCVVVLVFGTLLQLPQRPFVPARPIDWSAIVAM